MTVSQLIEALQQLPQHHFVVVFQEAANDDADPLDLATGVQSVRPLGHGIVLLEAE
jgi:hypothetical protein